jgi:hypothetical protein
MISYEEQIVDYMRTNGQYPLGYKNISRNTGIRPKYVFRTLINNERFERVNGRSCGSGKLGNSYFLLST